MGNDKLGARICPLVCVCCLLAALVGNGFDVPMTLLEGAVDEGAGQILSLYPCRSTVVSCNLVQETASSPLGFKGFSTLL